MITQEKIDEAKKIAEKATPGIWKLSSDLSQVVNFNNYRICSMDGGYGINMASQENDADFITCFNPEFCLKLIERIRKLEDRLYHLTGSYE